VIFSHFFRQKTGTKPVQALTDISHSALCYHSNETRASTANPPSSAQLEDTPTIPPTYTQVRAVVWECGEAETDTQTVVATIHFASSTPDAKNDSWRQFLETGHPSQQCIRAGALKETVAVSYRSRDHQCMPAGSTQQTRIID